MSRSCQNLWSHRRFNILYEPILPSDPAGLILLNREYQKRDTTRYTDIKMLELRHKWMYEQELIYGKDNLVCVLCGKQHLSPWTRNKNDLATLDHIIPIARAHHRWNDPTNFQIACRRCNGNKKDK